MTNLRRQLIDIQQQAERLVGGEPSVAEVEDFGRYSNEIRRYLLEHVALAEVQELVMELPPIQPMGVSARDGLLALLVPGVVWAWWRERQYLQEAKEAIRTCAGKYASIEFLTRHYFE